jgi:hypothetical protein
MPECEHETDYYVENDAPIVRWPGFVSRKEEALRYALAFGKISFAEYERKMKKIKHDIQNRQRQKACL